MLKWIKELNRKHPAATVCFGSFLLWVLVCTMLTVWLGRDVIEAGITDKSVEIRKNIEQELESMRDQMRSSKTGADNKILIKRVMESVLSIITYDILGFSEFKYNLFSGWRYDNSKELYGYWRAEVYNDVKGTNPEFDISSDPEGEDNTVILMMVEEDGVTYLEYPGDYYFYDVYEAINYLRNEGYFVSDSFGVYLTEGYRNGNEFKPVTVKIRAIDLVNGYNSREVEVKCTHGHADPDVYIPTEGDIRLENMNGSNNRIILSRKNNDFLNFVAETEMITKCLDGYGDKAAREFTYLCYLWESWEFPEGIDRDAYFTLEPLEHRFLASDDPSYFGFDNKNNYLVLRLKNDAYSGLKVPFSELSGDMFFGYIDTLEGADGKNLKVMFSGIIKGGLDSEKKEFYLSMFPLYIGMAVFFLLLALYWLKRFYSLEGKSCFHRSLINSMAHDLKTPLMIMQGFSENLKDNIHREKHGYYADQIVENAQYLEGLINKNIEVSNKPDHDPENSEVVHLSELVKKAESRYKERLDDKKLKIKQEGVSYLEGDPGIIGILVDNLISNAIKYSFEGETIEVFGAIKYFTIKNKAELHYNKNLKHLLDPLEMGDESRTAGAGTGLGLSIANGIARERGWKMKLSYDRKNKIFTCKVILRKWLS